MMHRDTFQASEIFDWKRGDDTIIWTGDDRQRRKLKTFPEKLEPVKKKKRPSARKLEAK